MKYFVLGILLAMVMAMPCMADEAKNVRTATAMMDAINERNLDALDEFIAPDVVRHSAATAVGEAGATRIGLSSSSECECRWAG